MNFKYLHPADQLVMIMQRIYDRGLTTTSGGNLSIHDDNGDIWITPKGIDKGTLTRNDIICVKPDGSTIGPHAPSSELPFHASVYKVRPDLKAVLHAHPPHIVAFSITRTLPEVALLPSVYKTCGKLKLAPYALPGSQPLGDCIAKEFAAGSDVVFLENHGVCIGGTNLFSAFMAFETLEYGAKLEIIAQKIGKPRKLTQEQLHLTDTQDHQNMDSYPPMLHPTAERAARRDMITLIHRSYDHGLFNATHGTYSVRLTADSFLITPYGLDRAYLSPEDLVCVKSGRKEQGKTPSRAVRFHEQIYRLNPDIGAVLLAHPPSVMAFAVTDAKFDPRTIPESYVLLREICKEPFGSIYSTPEKAACKFSPAVPAIIFENDCITVTGESLLQAFDRLEVAEATARSIILSRDIGNIVHITPAEVEELKVAFHLR
ncbi:MAG: class II aldolase/adducin family protein [Clostridia bacterium]